MTFGKKFAEQFGEDKTLQISAANVQAAVETFLRSVKALKDSDEVYSINLDDIIGKQPMDIVTIGIRVRKALVP